MGVVPRHHEVHSWVSTSAAQELKHIIFLRMMRREYRIRIQTTVIYALVIMLSLLFRTQFFVYVYHMNVNFFSPDQAPQL